MTEYFDVTNLDWSFFSRIYQRLDSNRNVFVNWNTWKLQETALSFIIRLPVEFYPAKFLIVSCIPLACLPGIIGIEMYEALKRKKDGAPVIPAL